MDAFSSFWPSATLGFHRSPGSVTTWTSHERKPTTQASTLNRSPQDNSCPSRECVPMTSGVMEPMCLWGAPRRSMAARFFRFYPDRPLYPFPFSVLGEPYQSGSTLVNSAVGGRRRLDHRREGLCSSGFGPTLKDQPLSPACGLPSAYPLLADFGFPTPEGFRMILYLTFPHGP